MKIVSGFQSLTNHIAREERDADGTVISWCNGRFGKLVDMDAEDLNSVGIARLCPLCVKASGYKAPSLVGWNSEPGWAHQ